MFKKIALAIALVAGSSQAFAKKAPEVTAPLWNCAITADINATHGFPIDIISLVRVWEGQGLAQCATPQGVFVRHIALKITKVGPAIGLDRIKEMSFLVPEVGVSSWDELFTSYSFGPSVDATAIVVHGQAGVGVTLKSSGGLTLQGALGVGRAEGLKLGVSILGSAEITDLGEANGLF